MILFLDACAVIYLIESEAAFHARVVTTLRDLRQRCPDARLAVSRLSLLECLVKPMRDGATELMAEYRAFFAADDLLVVELDARVAELALRLRAGDGLRTPDALQAASALTLPADGHRFLTNDQRFARIDGLRVIDLGGASRPDPAEQD